MTDDLRTLIETTLADADGLCLDSPDDRMVLAGLLLGRLRPLLDAEIEQHPTAQDAEIARLFEDRDALRDELSDLINACRNFSNMIYQPEFPGVRGIPDPAVDPTEIRIFNRAWEGALRDLKSLEAQP